MTALLDAALKERDLAVKDLADPESQSRLRKEADDLLKLEHAQNVEGAISTLRAYLEEHPQTPSLGALQGVLAKLTERQQRKQKTKKTGVWAGALAGLALLALAVKPLLKKKRPQRLNALPGMRHINTDDFTDPLALTAKDSRDRANAKND